MHLLHRGSFHYGYQTQSAGTEIRQLINPKRGALTRVTQLTYRSDSTAHALSLLRPLAYTVTSADAEASQADIVVEDTSPSSDIQSPFGLDETIATGDYLAWENADGTFGHGKVSSVSGNTITLADNLTKAINAGARVWIFYEAARTTAGSKQMIFQPAASTTHTFSDPIAGIAESYRAYEPLLFVSGNATNAGFLESLSGYYARGSQGAFYG